MPEAVDCGDFGRKEGPRSSSSLYLALPPWPHPLHFANCEALGSWFELRCNINGNCMNRTLVCNNYSTTYQGYGFLFPVSHYLGLPPVSHHLIPIPVTRGMSLMTYLLGQIDTICTLSFLAKKILVYTVTDRRRTDRRRMDGHIFGLVASRHTIGK